MSNLITLLPNQSKRLYRFDQPPLLGALQYVQEAPRICRFYPVILRKALSTIMSLTRAKRVANAYRSLSGYSL
jgi:hypothetical protein